VAAVMAVGKLFKKSKTKLELLDSAVEGESAATGSRHADNVAPSLFGGLQIVVDNDPLVVTDLPVPSKIYYVVVHPDLKIETKTARGILKPEISLKQFTKACCKGDMNLLRLTLKDTVIEPQRAHLIPGFSQAKQACADLGAIGFSISGAGPSVFAWADSKAKAAKIGSSIKKIFEDNQMLASVFVGRISKKGAYIKTK
jgi:homoserine kinase